MGAKEPPWVEPIVLEGNYVRLEPLRPKHARELARHAEPEVFRHFVTIIPRDQSVGSLKEYVAKHRASATSVPFAIISRETMKPVGSTSFMDIRSEHRALEIGMTWIARPWQGTRINPEAKLLMLEHAFDRLGAVRVQLKTDQRNLQSQHAIEKLGAVKEGVLRNYSMGPDGTVTNRVMYSITQAEWPRVKEGLIRRLAASIA